MRSIASEKPVHGRHPNTRRCFSTPPLGNTNPFAVALRLAKHLLVDELVTISLFERLSAALLGFAAAWCDTRSQSANHEYLITEVSRGRADAAESGSRHAFTTAVPDPQGASMHKLNSDLSEHYAAPGAGELAAIALVFDSGCVPAIRWLLENKGVKDSSLPKVLKELGANMCSHKIEYIIDGLKHDSEGKVDPALRKLNVQMLLQPGATQVLKEAFFIKLFEGKLGDIDWQNSFVLPIVRLGDPTHPSYAKGDLMQYTDVERHTLTLKYVGRLLNLLGKAPSVLNSYLALNTHWKKTYDALKAESAVLAKDCALKVESLMTAAWANAGQSMQVSLASGAPWSKSFVSETFSGLAVWNIYAAEAGMAGPSMDFFMAVIDSAVMQGIASGIAQQGPIKRKMPDTTLQGVGGQWQQRQTWTGQGDYETIKTHDNGVKQAYGGVLIQPLPKDPWFHSGVVRSLIRKVEGNNDTCFKPCLSVVVGNIDGPEETLEEAEKRCHVKGHPPGGPEHASHAKRSLILPQLVEGSTHFAELPSFEVANMLTLALSPAKLAKGKGKAGKGAWVAGGTKGGKGAQGFKGKGKGKGWPAEPFPGQAAQQ